MGSSFLRPAALVYVLGMCGLVLFTRSGIDQISGTMKVPFGGWDVVLLLIGEPYLVLYWTLPVATWFMVKQLDGTLNPENLVRLGSRTMWAFHQGWAALPWISFMVVVTILAGFAAAIGYPWQTEWGPPSFSPRVLLDLPELTPTAPVPAVAVLLQALALIVVLVAFVVVVSLCSVFIKWPRTAVVTAVSIVFWGIVSFRLSGGLLDSLAIATYAFPWYADRVFSAGPTAGILVLLVVGALVYLLAQRLELRGLRGVSFTLWPVALIAGALVLVGLFSRPLPNWSSQKELVLYALQGIGPHGLSIVDFLGNTLLVMLPAFAAHQHLVTALVERRYAEMIRRGTPSRWYLCEAPENLRNERCLRSDYGDYSRGASLSESELSSWRTNPGSNKPVGIHSLAANHPSLDHSHPRNHCGSPG